MAAASVRNTHPDALPPAAEPAANAGAAQPLRILLQILRERRWLAVSTAAFFLALLSAYAIFVPERPLYQARTLLLIEPERPRGSDALGALAGGEPEQGYYDTQEHILRSRTVARATLASLRTPSPAAAAHGAGQPPAVDVPAGDIDDFLGALGVSHVSSTRLVELTFRDRDPQYAARALTAHTESYIRQTVEFTLSASREASGWLARQVEEQEQRVTAGESALRTFQQAHGPVEERHGVEGGRLAELNSSVLRSRAARISKEVAFDRLNAAAATHDLRRVAALTPTPVTQQLIIDLTALERREVELSAEYGERHPERVKVRDAIKFTTGRLDEEVKRSIEVAGTDLAAARSEEQKSVAALEAETAAAAALGQRAAEMDALRREITSDRALYERLRQRAQEISLASTDELTNIRVVEPVEVPTDVLHGHRTMNLMLGGSAGLALTLLIVLGVHFADERLRSPEDVEACLGLPSIGVLPAINGVVLSEQIFLEAIKSVRAQVLCASDAQAVRMLLVASADVSEGKTLVATSLASGLAQVGRRVLLVDGDLRRPSVHASFGLPLEPGLSELLVGRADAARSVQPSGQPNLWILPAGRPTAHPADLLGMRAFHDAMEGFAATFDSVVIDSPPVLAATDASLVAHQQTATIFVISADRTGRRMAREAVDRLDAVGAKFVGVVLNRVSPDQYSGGYYARAHRYYYRAPADDAGATPSSPAGPARDEQHANH